MAIAAAGLCLLIPLATEASRPIEPLETPAAGAAPEAIAAPDQTIPVFEDVIIEWQEGAAERSEPDGFVISYKGQAAEATVDLPALPADQRDARRIIARIEVEPIYSEIDGWRRPNDPWTRLGTLTVLAPGEGDAREEVELIRFTTGFGGPVIFEQDVTELGPLLHGRATLRLFLSSYSEQPGWTVDVTLRYQEEAGYRRPVFARPIFFNQHVTRAKSKLRSRVTIPPGLARPRLRIVTTGHATDGQAGDEFVTRTHILRIDGREVLRWRPWSESGVETREQNPWAYRFQIDAREVWSSDIDRSGWSPGTAVEPLLVPADELTPGAHEIELEILDIRPKDPSQRPEGEVTDEHVPHGYWMVSAAVVADEPWPVPREVVENPGGTPPAGTADREP